MNTANASTVTAPKVSVLENEFADLLALKFHDLGVDEPEIAKAAAIGLFRLGARIAFRHAVHLTVGGAAQVSRWALFSVTDKLKELAPGAFSKTGITVSFAAKAPTTAEN